MRWSRRTANRGARLAVLVAGVLVLSVALFADGDVQDQFYRHVEIKNKTFEPHLPGETVDHFTGTLSIVQEDLSLPGKAGLDLKIVRAYSSRIWGRTDIALDPEPLLAEKDPSPLGYGWSLHMGRLQRPNATGQPLPCGGGDYPVYEAPDGSARTFYPLANSNTHFISRDWWTLDTQCTWAGGGSGACITTTTGDHLQFDSSAQFNVGVPPVWPLTVHEDVFGNAIEVTYLSGGRIDTITDTWNRTVSFSYSACGPRRCLDSITAAGTGGSRTVTYTYTSFPVPEAGGSRSFLTGVQPAAGPGYTYGYGTSVPVPQNRYALSSIAYPFGGATTYTYSTWSFFTGREDVPMAAVATRRTSGRALPTATWSYEYEAPRTKDVQTTTVTRPDLSKDVYEFVGFGFPARILATGNVWKVGLQTKASHADGAEVEELTWEKGAPVTTANFAAPFYGNGACPAWLWDTVVQSPILKKRVVTRDGSRYELETSGHDAFGQPGTVTETGEAQRPSHRPQRTTTYTYDHDMSSNQVIGRISKEETCQGTGSSDCVVNARTFNGPHRRKDTETLRGVTTEFGYWPNTGDLQKIANALGETLTLDGYAAGAGIPTSLDFNGAYTIHRTAYWDGSLHTESNGRGDVTTYDYDLAGRIKTVTPPGNNDASTYAYAPNGATYSVTRGSGTSAYVETTTLDGLGRVIDSSTGVGEKRTREYDGFGRVVFTSYTFAAGQPEIGDRFEFDGLGRPTKTSRRFVATGHRPLAGHCADPMACAVTVEYLADHCRRTTVDRGPSDTTGTRACFDSFADVSEERLRVVTDVAGKAWSYAYDVVGGLQQLTAPKAAGHRSFTFTPGTFFPETETSGPRGTTRLTDRDDMGHPLSREDAARPPAVTTFEYDDPLSRTTLVKYGTGSDDDVERTYDRDVLETVHTNNGGTYTYGYDELGRITSQKWEFRGQTFETTYEYDSSGCLERLTYPTRTKATMTCDAKGRPKTVDRVPPGPSPTTETMARDVTYHPLGRIASMTFGNGLVVTTTLTNGRLESIRTPGVLDLAFTYDGADNVTRLVDAVMPSNTLSKVTYDKLDRLFDVTTAAGVASYRYDELGNRTEKTVPGEGKTTYVYDTMTNRLSSSTGPSALPVMTVQWTPAERIAVTSDGATYQYDGLGHRVSKTFPGGGEVFYHRDPSGRLLAETTPSGDVLREYFYVADQLVAVHGCPDGTLPGCNVTQWYHTDHLGSVRARTDAARTVQVQFAYQTWGESAGSGPVLFNGRALDDGPGLYDFGARAYAPKIGRFVSADTVWTPAAPQGANPYAFGLNNPLKYTDPDGHLAWVVVTGAIGGVIGGAAAAYVYRDLNGWEYAAKVAGGVGAGVLGGIGLGTVVPVALGLPATASAGSVYAGLYVEAANLSAILLGVGKAASDRPQAAEAPAVVNYGQQKFAGSTGFGVWGNVSQEGNRLIIRDFTMATRLTSDRFDRAIQLRDGLDKLLAFAQSKGATTIVLEGVFANGDLGKMAGGGAGTVFSYSIPATREALMKIGSGL